MLETLDLKKKLSKIVYQKQMKHLQERLRLLAESEGTKARLAAENTRSDSLMKLELERYRLEKMPEIIAQMMKPAEKIESIRIHQVSGLGAAPGTGNGSAEGGSRPPVNRLKLTPVGRVPPTRERVAAGLAVVVTVNEPLMPTVKVVAAGLVKLGGLGGGVNSNAPMSRVPNGAVPR